MPREHALGESLRHGYLEFDVGVGFGGLRSYRRTENEVIVFVESEERAVVKGFAHAVGVNHLTR